ncbi:MAG: reverse transcriptase domain-containing protein [Myxococcota bacterium]
MEDGALTRSDLGTPQGGVISPLLANIYLHYAVDEWFAVDVVSRLRGRAHLVRYADDFVMVFQHEDDARRVLEVLPEAPLRFGLEVSPEDSAGPDSGALRAIPTHRLCVRLPRLHLPLGGVEESSDDTMEDGEEAACPHASLLLGVLPGQPPRPVQGAARRPQPETLGALHTSGSP